MFYSYISVNYSKEPTEYLKDVNINVFNNANNVDEDKEKLSIGKSNY